MAGYEAFGLEHGQLVDPDRIPHFTELSEQYADDKIPLLDQEGVNLHGLTADQQHWRDYGYVIKKGFIPNQLIDEYQRLRDKLELGAKPFHAITAYLNYSVIRDICCSPELHALLTDLLGEELGLHFILTDYKSTERGWHQDDYLNPEDTFARYAAVWIAMDDIDLESGPFEFVPGSHKWPCMRNGKVKELVVPEIRNDGTHHWAVVAEHLVNKSVRNFIQETESKVVQFQAKRGDVLVWHGKLMHRGSIPIRPDKLRPAIIAHYSNIRSRRDLGREIARHGRGGYFWQFRFVDNPLTPDLVERTPPHGASTDLGTTGEAKARSKLSHYFGRARTRLKTILPGPRA